MNLGGGNKQRGGHDVEEGDDDDDDDIEHGNRPVKKRRKIRGNQDLWLLYLLFKAASLLW